MVARSQNATGIVWLLLLTWLAIVPALAAASSPRFFGSDYAIEVAQPATALQIWLGRIATWGTLLALLGATLYGWARRESRSRCPMVAMLLVSAAAFAGACLVSMRFGSPGGFQVDTLGLPLAVLALSALPAIPAQQFAKYARWALGGVAWSSWLAVLIVPDWAATWTYADGAIPGFTLRLYGVTPHANMLGPMMVSYLVLGWATPARSMWARLTGGVVAAALVASQSKTAWALLVILYGLRVAALLCSQPLTVRVAWISLLTAGAILAASILVLATDIERRFEHLWGVLRHGRFATLTGRMPLWLYTLGVWLKNPWFGYGPHLWDRDMRLAYLPILGWAPPHAHNQLIQTLGEAGILGAIALVAYGVMLLQSARSVGALTQWAAPALAAGLVLRGVTEVPLRQELADGNFYLHFLVLAFVVLALRERARVRYPLLAPTACIRRNTELGEQQALFAS